MERQRVFVESLEARQLFSVVAGNVGHFQASPAITPLVATTAPVGVSLSEFQNAPFTATVGSFSSTSSASSLSVKINWGDGTSSRGTLQLTSPGQYNVIGSHTYTTANTFNISVVITKRRSVVATIQSTAAVASDNLDLTGSITGTYVLTASDGVSTPNSYTFTGSGTTARLGAVTLSGTVTMPGNVTGTQHGGGVLTLTTATGTVSLRVTGEPAQPAFSPLSPTLNYIITGGTGSWYAGRGHGVITVTLGAGNTFTFSIQGL